ncbi:MAG: YbaB/EbfC family nucleoid-associated protein [Actinomycetia bacterium]|nr:YbaB/EbfC family nucleoid-associated protein [Actinomycetes bacterium]
MVFPDGQPDLGQLLQQAQRVQQQLAQAREEIAAARLSGTAGGGLVRATVTGALELVELTVDRSVVDPEDVETLVDLVLAAVRDAQRQAHELQSAALGPLAQSGIPGMPGLPGT